MNTQGEIKIMVRGAYDLQKLRIQMGNRIVANFKGKLGQAPGQTEAALEREAKKMLADLRSRYRRLVDGLVRAPSRRNFNGDEVISSFTELCLVEQYVALEAREAAHFRRLGAILEEVPIYTAFLRGVKGVGPAMAGVMVSEIDIAKARTPSSLWAYAGLDVGPDGAGRSKRREHLVKIKYTDKDGAERERDGITFNPFLKTKLVGVLAASFLRSKSPYRDIYDGYKHRLESRADFADHAKGAKGHRHNAALRYMIKMFLIDLYRAWRELEGLPVAKPYHEAKLGIRHAA